MQNFSTIRPSLVFMFAMLASAAGIAQEPAATETAATTTQVKIDCVEVQMFKVAEEKVEGQTDRATLIPERNLEIIRDALVKRLGKNTKTITVVAAGSGECPNAGSAAILGGDILDFRKGNQALRYFVGFGAGSQKVRVRLNLMTKDGNALLGQDEISDTKWAGAFGGTNTKGLENFADKAAQSAAGMLKKY